MKLKAWVAGWLLSFCISFGAVSALVTAFGLYDVSLPELGLFLLVLCALCGWAFLAKKGPIFLFSFMGVLLVCSLFWQGLWHSIQAVAYQLSTVFHAAYGWGELDISRESEIFSQVPGVYFLGTFPAISITWAVCRREKLLFPLSIALLPLYPCFVVTDTAPESWCFLLILGAVLVLVLTQSLRRLSHRDGNRMIAFALIPAVLLSIFLVAIVPEEGYWSKFPTLQTLLGQGANTGDGVQTTLGMPTANRMDLTSAGPVSGTNQAVMTVRSASRGFLYLRYQSFDSYNGTQWLATDLPEDPAFWPEEEDLASLGYTSITTMQPYEGLFIPYYAQNGRYLLLQNGKQPNDEKLTKYRISVGLLRDSGYGSESPDLTPYLALPEATRAAAQQILQKNDLKTPEDILQYVKNSATYSTLAEAPPKGTEDFAIWFLQKGETGYCVHFATAAAVLLRAAGYPARYVAGYALFIRKNVTVTVKENHAHAWVEYADPENGYLWQVFEATPGDFSADSTPPPTTEPSDSSEPTRPSTEPGTQPSTEPGTQPSAQPSLPGQSTTPSGTNNGSATAPSTQAAQQQPSSVASSRLWSRLWSLLWPWLLRLGIVLTGIVALWIQYRIRFRRRLKAQRVGTSNARALARWQEISLLSRLLKAPPPEELLELAEKARFSQHTMTKEELFRLGQYLGLQRKAIHTIPVWKRFFLRLIWAI